MIEKWECEFLNDIQKNANLKAFVESRRPQTPQRNVNQDEILNAVKDDRLFGMVECDIRVPQNWPLHFQYPSMTPYEYLQEMSPLFCTTDVPFEVIGEHMQQDARQFEQSRKPRQLLVGGMKAKQILLATPLLRWYLSHGMEVTKIYQVVEYQRQTCFSRFAEQVTVARQQGDVDPSKAIISDTEKVRGNAAYKLTLFS